MALAWDRGAGLWCLWIGGVILLMSGGNVRGSYARSWAELQFLCSTFIVPLYNGKVKGVIVRI
ncbi:hypothetical protein L873DRAFT_1818831 [Choiromyces venosus 120613-1]|uniref:Uncharacterized protein n=1 Tax=Choiromyces venosus 120613-1 TaxID=1336337 RepID=A0A3N4J0Y7_9PEZI|nr:hypothetical protein L873DRAFT_1818831 [Choiromyces venosus 120613-1]